MAMDFNECISAELDRHGALVRLVIVEKKGSAPREVGTSMFVGAAHTSGTIGGGTLEYQAILQARKLLTETVKSGKLWARLLKDYPLGPALGQCCGGSVKLLMEVFTNRELSKLRPLSANLNNCRSMVLHPLTDGDPVKIISPERNNLAKDTTLGRFVVGVISEDRRNKPVFLSDSKTSSRWFVEPFSPAQTALYLYGAGHVGREIVRVIDGLPFDLHWIDFDELRFPKNIREHVKVIITDEPHRIAENSRDGAFHLVMTYSHPVDLAVCHSVLKRNNFSYLGLIGSETKRTRFLKRLRESGIEEQSIGRLICPIGIDVGGARSPAMIAVSVAAQLIKELELKSKNKETPEMPVEMASHDEF